MRIVAAVEAGDREDTLNDALRVSLVDIVAGWDVPAEQKVEKTICSAIRRGFFRLSHPPSSATFAAGESRYYSLGEQTIPPKWTVFATYGVELHTGVVRYIKVGNALDGRQGETRSLSPVFVNSTVSSFADCLDEFVALDSKLAEIGDVPLIQWDEGAGNAGEIDALAASTRRMIELDARVFENGRNFWYLEIANLWDELMSDGIGRFNAITGATSP